MRPTQLLLSTLLGPIAVTAATALPALAQDRDRTTERRIEIDRVPGGTRVWRFGAVDRDRAALGISLGAGGLADTAGVRVTDVLRDGPAAKAGVEEGDRIVAIDGTSLRVPREDAEDRSLGSLANRRLERALERKKAGDEVQLQVQRGRETRTVRVKTVAAGDLPRESVLAFGPGVTGYDVRALRDSARARAERRPALGISVGGTGTVRDTLGLFVSSVTAGGPAERAGIVEGDRVQSINGVDVRVPREDADDRMLATARSNRFTRELQKAKPGDNVALRVWSGGQVRTVTVRAGSAAEVFRDEGVFVGDGMTITVPRAPLAPAAPGAPRVFQFDGSGAPQIYFRDGAPDGVRMLLRPTPQVRVEPPRVRVTTPRAPSGAPSIRARVLTRRVVDV